MENGNISEAPVAPQDVLPGKVTWKYEPSYAAKLLHLLQTDMARSISQCCVRLNITRQTFYTWLKDNPEFKQAWEIGKEYMQMHYEDDAKEIANGEKGRNASATMHKYLMSAVLEDYRERKEIHVIDDFRNMTPAQLMAEARRKLSLLPADKLLELGFDKHQLEQMIEGSQL